MSIVKPTNKEQLIHYLLMQLSLGTYDRRFLTNTLNLNISKKKPVTTNQALLLDKIVSRYSKQLAKKGLSVDELIDLKWSLEPIESTMQYTDAYVSIDGNTLKITSPFKTGFVKELRNLSYAVWHKDDKYWSMPAGMHTLKKMHVLLAKHYPNVHYCADSQSIINEADQYDEQLFWNPTLVKRNGRLYVIALSNNLADAIADLELNDDPATLARLVRYGITISPSVLEHTDDTINFAITVDPEVDAIDPVGVAKKIMSVKPDIVIIYNNTAILHNAFAYVIVELKTNGVNVQQITKAIEVNSIDIRSYEFPVIINAGVVRRDFDFTSCAGKVINVVNSTPIDLYRKR